MDVLLGFLLFSVIIGATITAFSQVTAASRVAQQRSLLTEVMRAASTWAWQNASRLPSSGLYTFSPSDWGEIQAGGKFTLPPGATLTGELDLSAMRLNICIRQGSRLLRCETLQQSVSQ